MIYGFVMAAGASRRFGDIKQLAKIDGVSMAHRSYNILNKVLKGRTYLVLGANAAFIVRDFKEVNTMDNILMQKIENPWRYNSNFNLKLTIFYRKCFYKIIFPLFGKFFSRLRKKLYSIKKLFRIKFRIELK